ncbi:MAG: hypothetical protein JXR63_09690 [Spirochaetales bacterium]|nr:hypothetical protein [Spirochaetales bacterium]
MSNKKPTSTASSAAISPRYVIFPGCVPSVAERKVLRDFFRVAKRLAIPIIQEKAFSCCGGAHLQDISVEKSLLLNARNLALAEQSGDILITICNTCQLSLLESKTYLDKHPQQLKEINNILAAEGLPPYTGKIQIRHFLYILYDFIVANPSPAILEKIQQAPQQKIYPYYGCHLLRPSCMNQSQQDAEETWSPQIFTQLIEACGSEAVTGRLNLDCCGFHRVLTTPRTSTSLAQAITDEAIALEASTLLTTCPLCKFSLSLVKQSKVKILHVEEWLARMLK